MIEGLCTHGFQALEYEVGSVPEISSEVLCFEHETLRVSMQALEAVEAHVQNMPAFVPCASSPSVA